MPSNLTRTKKKKQYDIGFFQFLFHKYPGRENSYFGVISYWWYLYIPIQIYTYSNRYLIAYIGQIML